MDMKKALGEALEKEFVEKVEKALQTLENYYKEYEVVKTSANLQAVIKFEEYQQFDKLGAYLNGVLKEAKNRYKEMKFYESALLLTKASMIKDDLDKIVEVISGRLEEEENSSELKHVNVPYIMFITKFDDEMNFDYYETMTIVESNCTHYISWLDEDGVRRFTAANSKIDAMQMAMAKGLGRDSVYCKYQ